MRDHQIAPEVERLLDGLDPDDWADAAWWTAVEWKAFRAAALRAIHEGATVQEVRAGTRREARLFKRLAFQAARLSPDYPVPPDALATIRAEVAAGVEAEHADEPVEPEAFVDAVEDALRAVLASARAMAERDVSVLSMARRVEREFRTLAEIAGTAPTPRGRRRERAPVRSERDTAFLPLWRERERLEEVGAKRRAAEEDASRGRRTGGGGAYGPGERWWED